MGCGIEEQSDPSVHNCSTSCPLGLGYSLFDYTRPLRLANIILGVTLSLSLMRVLLP
jgi:hypothetical protein